MHQHFFFDLHFKSCLILFELEFKAIYSFRFECSQTLTFPSEYSVIFHFAQFLLKHHFIHFILINSFFLAEKNSKSNFEIDEHLK